VQKFTNLPTPVCRDGRIPFLTNCKDPLSAKVALTCFIKEEKFTTPRTENGSRNPAVAIFNALVDFSPTATCFDFARLRSVCGINYWKSSCNL